MKIISNSDGTGSPVNPFGTMDKIYGEAYNAFDKANPSLPIFKDGKPYLEVGEVECGLVWQYYDVVRDCWDEGITSSAEHYKGCGTRQIYRVLPSESESKDIEEEISDSENVRQLLKALTILNDASYKISDSTYQVQFSSKMKSEIEKRR